MVINPLIAVILLCTVVAVDCLFVVDAMWVLTLSITFYVITFQPFINTIKEQVVSYNWILLFPVFVNNVHTYQKGVYNCYLERNKNDGHQDTDTDDCTIVGCTDHRVRPGTLEGHAVCVYFQPTTGSHQEFVYSVSHHLSSTRRSRRCLSCKDAHATSRGTSQTVHYVTDGFQLE